MKIIFNKEVLGRFLPKAMPHPTARAGLPGQPQSERRRSGASRGVPRTMSGRPSHAIVL